MKAQAPRSLRPAATLLLLALCLHNAEEWLTFGAYRDRSAATLTALLGRPIVVPSAATFHALLVAATLVGAGVAVGAGVGRASEAKRRLLSVFAFVLLVNIAVPHVPAAMLMGGYAPGVVTAVLINLPISLWALRRLSRTPS